MHRLLSYLKNDFMTNQLCLQQQCGRLYKKMDQQLAGYETMATDEKKRIEWGFGIATKAWFRIQEEVDSYLFADQQEEISFYKTLKPKFISLMDYFTQLYKSVLFQPEDSPGKKKYWKNELVIGEFFYRSTAHSAGIMNRATPAWTIFILYSTIISNHLFSVSMKTRGMKLLLTAICSPK
jgi:hypothetical protein